MDRIVFGAVLLTMLVPASLKAAEDARQVERGKYLVHHVAMCIYCHTPKDNAGNLVMDSLLKGSPIPLNSPYTQQSWGFQAPNLRALPSRWGNKEFIEFLRTGKTPNGYSLKSPMPPYRMSLEDASAVAAYLDSLTTSK